METIQTLWERIDAWFKNKALSIWDPSSSLGASEEEIGHAEAALGVTLPDDFKSSYRLHNGGCPFPPWPEGLMPLTRIVGVWQMLKEIWDEGSNDDFPDEPVGPVQPFHWHPKWIPFAWGGYGAEYACLDLDPGPGGQFGQIILRTHESDPARLLAPSFEVWLATFANDLKTGKYIVNEGRLERKAPLKQRVEQGLSQVLQHGKQLFQQSIRIFRLFRQAPKQAFSLVMIALVKPAARDFWVRLRSSLRTRWVRVLATSLLTVAWSPDGAYLVSGLDTQVQLWNARTGELLRSFPTAMWSGWVAWLPDGQHLLLVGAQGSIQRVQALDGTPVSTYRFPDQNEPVSQQSGGPIRNIACSPDGGRIAAARAWQGNVSIWDVHHEVLLSTHSWHTSGVVALAWSPDGAYLATASYDGTAQLWSADGTSHLWTFSSRTEPGSALQGLSWSPDGRLIALGDGVDGQVQLIAARDGHHIVTYPRHMLHRSWLFPNKDSRAIYALAWSPDSRTIVSGDSKGTLCVWRTRPLLP